MRSRPSYASGFLNPGQRACRWERRPAIGAACGNTFLGPEHSRPSDFLPECLLLSLPGGTCRVFFFCRPLARPRSRDCTRSAPSCWRFPLGRSPTPPCSRQLWDCPFPRTPRRSWAEEMRPQRIEDDRRISLATTRVCQEYPRHSRSYRAPDPDPETRPTRRRDDTARA